MASALVLGACGDDSGMGPEPSPDYLDPTSPENVVNNLAESHRLRDIDGYAVLLAPEFIFKVQPGNVAELGEFFTRDRDSAGTAALFNSPIVTEIRILLTHGVATVPTDTTFAPGTMTIRIQPTFLEVDETTGITWQVDGDIQDLFFRKGNAADGEDPTHWLIIEWRDIPAGAFGPEEKKLQPPSVRRITWGRIKTMYSNQAVP